MTTKTVALMKKITLSFSVDSENDSGKDRKQSPAMDIIVGVGSRGLTPFEYELLDKAVGSRLRVSLPSHEFHSFFEHLASAIHKRLPQLPQEPIRHFSVEIDAITEPTPKEIIKAIAAATDGCSDGGCGCGCH
ncbi:MAG: hypothetical protein PVH30_07050 [Desulfobacterales bacterium]|jgi:hypothetical protein